MKKIIGKSCGIAAVLVVLYWFELTYMSEFFQVFHIAGSVICECILALTGIFIFWLFRGKMKQIFPFHMPKFWQTLGTLLLWAGAYSITMIITVSISYLFPKEMMEAGSGVQSVIEEVPFFTAMIAVAVTPAICEEIAFRGALYSCFRWMKKRWIGVIIVSLIFGAFHGSVWRMIPTTILGMLMGYLLMKTENMCYNILFHMVNNAVPVIMMNVLKVITNQFGEEMSGASQTPEISLAVIGGYLILGCMSPLLLYLGNICLHYKLPGKEEKKIEKKKLICVGVSAISLIFAGLSCLICSMLWNL